MVRLSPISGLEVAGAGCSPLMNPIGRKQLPDEKTSSQVGVQPFLSEPVRGH